MLLQWSASDSGTPVRLPALGPFIPLVNPVLLLVTEAHLCNVLYMHPRTEQVHALSASLSRRSSSKEGPERSVGESVDGPRGLGRCVHAAIGLGYDGVFMHYYFTLKPGLSRPIFLRDIGAYFDIFILCTVPPNGDGAAAINRHELASLHASCRRTRNRSQLGDVER